ncbi:MAG: hypothetical protein UT55_C0039G0008 [Candidatus Peregrinibacteria bacterium GW2011_GWE2_39_6]|nr:MAG: hypothetical protein UT36_C0001G0204 [Candidatus Peregrinibacteria bacterium GW2011_GWF2_39_17]KKR25537.1 MAG: hypothetical protein UT55_C0039G0008 [Candidatus Peregrinibacteria bacterium GW2011_GWE2_39_6]HCW32642.1 hypothetical protein [Candidatus Peregrinibacteria bacterium]
MLTFFFKKNTSLVVLSLIGLFSLFAVAEARFYLSPVDLTQDVLVLNGVPGGVVSAEFNLVNDSDINSEFNVGVVDAESTEEKDGFFALSSSSAEQYAIGLWGKLSETKVQLGPKAQKTLTVTLTIPDNTKLGDYWGGVWAMEVAPEEESAEATGLSFAIRNGLRLHLVVSEPVNPGLLAKFEDTDFKGNWLSITIAIVAGAFFTRLLIRRKFVNKTDSK